MIHQTIIRFYSGPRIGDYLDIRLVKHELGKSYNGYLDKGRLEWQEIPEGSMWDGFHSFMVVPYNFPIQELVDALTDSKVLPPTKQVEIDAELKATRRHLEDMRKLVFKEDTADQGL